MIVTSEVEILRRSRWSDPSSTWGLVTTMGYLHEGHLSLVRQAVRDNDQVGVSIYVNPTQFGPGEDLDRYPRDLESDLEKVRKEGVNLVFTPNDAVMYPEGFQTKVEVTRLTRVLEGKARPTHFAGVTTVVTKLFNIFQPHRAYFGQKDAQQSAVISRLVLDLGFNLDIVICPTIRENDGLAMSSRNVRLSPEQRKAAVILYRTLVETINLIKEGEMDAERLRNKMTASIIGEPLARLDYVSIADPDTLIELDQVKNKALISLAVFFEEVRLIDNMLLTVS